jgi:hypothetical protein
MPQEYASQVYATEVSSRYLDLLLELPCMGRKQYAKESKETYKVTYKETYIK